ncbi:MAG TPA: hemerythrin domain-containing protein [Polyangiaceae bacterium]|jgi:hemerythrin-like domain-containing protein
MSTSNGRRVFLVASGVSGATFLLGCKKNGRYAQAHAKLKGRDEADEKEPAKDGGEGEPEVTATEDLMREHGVIRRALTVYREAATLLRTTPSALPLDALHRTAKLLRTFAEDYHERQLEEEHIFPALKRTTGAAAGLVETLTTQHARGREITEYVIASTNAAMTSARAEPLARTLESFARMYEEHAALEDTVVFPAWKALLSPKELDDAGELFEDIEHQTFGKDGFDDAVDQISAVERAFGIELGRFTPPPPPKP